MKNIDKNITATMFWGLLLEEGKFYSQKVQKPFHVSMAALEPSGKGGQPLTVNLEQDGMDFILCTLKEETLYQQALDLNFAEGDEIKFFLSGKGTVHLTGYVVCEEDDDFGEEESSDEDEAPKLSEPVKEKSKAPEKAEKKVAIKSKAKEESEESEEESEDDSDDDSDEEMEPPPKIKKPSVPDKKLEAEKKPEKPVADKKKKPEKKAEPEKKVEPKKVEPEEDSDEESDEDESDEDESDSDEEVKTSKPVADKEKKETKKAAAAAKDSDDSDDDDDDDESDSDDDGGIDFKKLMQETSSGDDDDDDDDIDMDEMDKEGEDEDSDDSSEEETRPPKKAKKVTPASTPVSTPTTDKSKSKKEKRASILKEQSKATPEPVQAGKKRKEIDTPLQNGIDGSAKKNKKNKQDKDSPVKTPKKTIKGGIVLEDLQVGTGPESVSGKYVSVHYTGKLKSNNKEFDSNTSGKGFKFRLGGNEVIKGWDLGLVGMKVGGKRRLTIPAKMAYGDKGSAPEIPPKADLVFDVELKAVS